MSKNGRLITAVAAVVVVVVVADRQQRLTISMRGRNAVAPQTVLTLLKGCSATSKDIPAAALLAAPRGTAYIYQVRDSHKSISRLSSYGGRPAPVALLDSMSRSAVSLVFFFNR